MFLPSVFDSLRLQTWRLLQNVFYEVEPGTNLGVRKRFVLDCDVAAYLMYIQKILKAAFSISKNISVHYDSRSNYKKFSDFHDKQC